MTVGDRNLDVEDKLVEVEGTVTARELRIGTLAVRSRRVTSWRGETRLRRMSGVGEITATSVRRS